MEDKGKEDPDLDKLAEAMEGITEATVAMDLDEGSALPASKRIPRYSVPPKRDSCKVPEVTPSESFLGVDTHEDYTGLQSEMRPKDLTRPTPIARGDLGRREL